MSTRFGPGRLQTTMCAALSVLAGSAIAETPAELLDKLKKQRTEVRTLHMITRTVFEAEDARSESVVERWEKFDGKLRKERTLSKTTRTRGKGKTAAEVETLSVSDGLYAWREVPAGETTLVVKAKASTASELDGIRTLLANSKARVKGRDKVNGEQCAIIEILIGADQERSRTTYWISESYGLVLKSLVLRSDHSKTQVTTNKLEVNKPVSDDMFVYEPPAGARVIDAERLGGRREIKSKP